MTTWHKASLDDAVDFFLACTVRDKEFGPAGCASALAVVIGSVEWTNQIEQHIRKAIAAD
jgi:hypothetical protein